MTDTEKSNLVKEAKPYIDGKVIITRVFRYIIRYKFWFFLSLIFLVVLSASQVGIAAILEPIINEGVVGKNAVAATWLPIIILLLMIVRSFVSYGSSYLMAKIGRSTIRDIREDFFNKTVYLSSEYYDNVSSSTLVSKFLYDIEQTAVMMTETLTSFVRNSLTALGLIGWMVYLDWRLCLVAIVSVPVVASVTSYTNKKFRKSSQEIQNSMGDIAETIKESASGHKVVKVYGAQKTQVESFKKTNQDNFMKNMRRARVSAAIVPVTTLSVAPVFAIILYIYLNFLVDSADSAGKFVSFLGALVMLMSPLKSLAKVNEKLQVGITAANSIFQIIDLPEEVDNGKQKITNCKGNIVFKDVHFNYKNESKRVISNVSFEVKPGERVALVGASGSGKSTIASLLMRFYATKKGVITLDDIDISDYSLENYRSMISLVNQEPLLFDNSIKHNIAYGVRPEDVDQARLKAAMDAAYVTEFIDELPDGVETSVGEDGLRLSGGQRQRISIARAFYKNAPIIILDEATSALDVKSERYIQKALDTLMDRKTSIVIAHRLSTIESADKIIVLQEGIIVESGTHKELLAHDGAYADFQKIQNNGNDYNNDYNMEDSKSDEILIENLPLHKTSIDKTEK